MRKIEYSFYDWCINNNHQDYLNAWDYDDNKVSPKDVGAKSNKKYSFKCLENKNHSNSHYSLNSLTLKNELRCKNCDSFGQWCLDNSHKEYLELWDYDLNNEEPFLVPRGSARKLWFKCPRGLHDSEQFNIHNVTAGSCKIQCRKCNSFAQWGTDKYGDNFLEKYWSNKNKCNPWEIDHYSSSKFIYINCANNPLHGYFKTKPSDFLIKGGGCPYCNGHRLHISDSLGVKYPQVFNVWSDKNNKTPYDYSCQSNERVWWKCPSNKHEDFIRTVSNQVTLDFTCHQCIIEMSESKLQYKVRCYLENMNYEVLHENECSISVVNPLTNGIMRFDNEVEKSNLIIEVHGIQHYEITGFTRYEAKRNNTTPEEELKKQQWRDKYKMEYALACGYNYLCIPYWEENNDEYINSINNKLKELN